VFNEVKPPTERRYAEALNAIRDARWQIREERRQKKLTQVTPDL